MITEQEKKTDKRKKEMKRRREETPSRNWKKGSTLGTNGCLTEHAKK